MSKRKGLRNYAIVENEFQYQFRGATYTEELRIQQPGLATRVNNAQAPKIGAIGVSKKTGRTPPAAPLASSIL